MASKSGSRRASQRAYGLRNVQGLAFHPVTGPLLAADHGPQARDQLHRVVGGRNYGWPRVLGAFAAEDLGDQPMGQSEGPFGRLRALAVAPDGAIYLGTSTRDRGRGVIRDGDDRIVRIAPR